MSWDFHVGQKVVYVGPDYTLTFEKCPEQGKLYTIRAIESQFPVYADTMMVIWLEEIVNPVVKYACCPYRVECPWPAHEFRPLESKSMDLFMSIVEGVGNHKLVVDDPELMPVLEPQDG
jgi:hypothetical protein